MKKNASVLWIQHIGFKKDAILKTDYTNAFSWIEILAFWNKNCTDVSSEGLG